MTATEIFRKPGLFPGSPTRATFHKNLSQDRSESSVVVNPKNSANLIGASKLFTNPHQYKFTVAVIFSMNGGSSWHECAPLKLLAGWEGLSDPCLAFGPNGVAYLVAEPLDFNYAGSSDYDPSLGTDILVTRMVCYRSTDGGATWSDPILVDGNQNKEDRFDKPWVAVDPKSGTVYISWGYSNLQFARSTNNGLSWIGVGAASIDTLLGGGAAPEVNVDDAGTVHVFSHSPTYGYISYLRSKNGGQSFEPERQISSGLTDLDSGIAGSGFKHFPNATFRVLTLSSACCVPKQTRIALAWADYREGYSRIYYNLSSDAGDTWSKGSGAPLLPVAPGAKIHDFHPQIISTRSGLIGCAFYRYYESTALIDVMFTASFDGGASFWFPIKVAANAWNPAINAPWSHGNSGTTFIGDYFGLDADDDTFYLLWTGTEEGVQELYFNSIATSKVDPPDELGGIVGRVFGGVANDGGGFVIVGGKIIRVPPREPVLDILHGLVALDSVQRIQSAPSGALEKSLLRLVANVANQAAEKIRG